MVSWLVVRLLISQSGSQSVPLLVGRPRPGCVLAGPPRFGSASEGRLIIIIIIIIIIFITIMINIIVIIIGVIRRHSCSVSLLQAAFARRTRSARDAMSGHTLQQTDVPRGMPHGSLPAIPDGLATRVASAAAAQAPSAAGWHWKCYYCGVANFRARTECAQCGEEEERRECSLKLQRQRYSAYAADSGWPWVADAVCGDAVGAPAAATPCGELNDIRMADKWAMLAKLVRLREHALRWTLAADSHSDVDAAPSSASASVAAAGSDESWVVVDTSAPRSASASVGHEAEDVWFDCFAEGFQ